MKKVVIAISVVIVFVALLTVGVYSYFRFYALPQGVKLVTQDTLKRESGFEVKLPKYLPEGYILNSYEATESKEYEPERLILRYKGPNSDTIVLIQSPLSSDDPDYAINFIERTKSLFKNFQLNDISLSSNNYAALIGDIPSSSLDETMDTLLTWKDDVNRYNLFLNNPEALPDEELVKFAESLY